MAKSELPGSDQRPAIKVLMMPRDTNAHGTIFGGIILSYIDQAGAVAAVEAGCERLVTVAMDKVEFHEPVAVGDLVSFYAKVCRVGTTSMAVHVTVVAQRHHGGGTRALVTEASVTYVNIGDRGRPRPIVVGTD
jgi:acyl-CoA thioesterase YciA